MRTSMLKKTIHKDSLSGGQADLHTEFQDSQMDMEKPVSKTKQQNKAKTKN